MRDIINTFKWHLMPRLYFGGGGPSAPPPPKPPPKLQDSAASLTKDSSSNRAGFGSTILTSGAGVLDQKSSKKTLLGS